MRAGEMIASHPHAHGKANTALAYCIEACFDCSQVCTSCADACLGEAGVAELVQCIRLDLDCADLCIATGTIATRRAGGNVPVLRAQLEACRLACMRCAEECDRHGDRHEHCRICADACRECADACRAAMENLSGIGEMH